MKVERIKLEDAIISFITNKLYDNDVDSTAVINNICNYALAEYNAPFDTINDCLTDTKFDLKSLSEYTLFILYNSIYNIYTKMYKDKLQHPDSFFTELEMKKYSTIKYEDKSLVFPLRFRTIQITNDQWIGRTTTREMLALRDAQLINYNVNTQRVMQRIIKGTREIFKIKVVQSAVNSIKTLFKKKNYIPTPYTLNIPLEETDFYYDEDSYELVINSLNHFDIIDGYHRYVSACQLHDVDENFDYPMELRIVNFSEEKAQQYIWQQNQKTKMKKVDAMSMNTSNSANVVVKMVNENSTCLFKGLIDRNDAIINFADLALLVDYFYFKGREIKNERAVIVEAVKDLTESFNIIAMHHISYIEQKYDYKKLVAVMYLFNKLQNKKNDIELYIDDMVKAVSELSDGKFYDRKPKKSMMLEFDNIFNDLAK